MHRKGWENTWRRSRGTCLVGLRTGAPRAVGGGTSVTPSMGGLSLCSLPHFRLWPPNLQSIFSPSGHQILGVALPDPVQALLP